MLYCIMAKKEAASVSRAVIHSLYTQTVHYKSQELALRNQVRDLWSRYRKPILHNQGHPAEKTFALRQFNNQVSTLLKNFHEKHHAVVFLDHEDDLDQDFPFFFTFDFQTDDLPYFNPAEACTRFPLRTLVFDLNSGLDEQLKAAKEFLEGERLVTEKEFKLEPTQRRTDLSSIHRNLSLLVEKDSTQKTYAQLSERWKLTPSTLKSMYSSALKLIASGEIHRLFSPFSSDVQPEFKLTLKR